MADRLEVCLAGAVTLACGDRVVQDQAFGGRQLRLVTAILVLDRGAPTTADRMADALWPDGAPDQWKPALRGLVSKLRNLLEAVGLPRSCVDGTSGNYQLVLDDVAVDLESIPGDLAAAAHHLAAGDGVAAAAAAGRARSISSRPFLPGVDSWWADDVRSRLRGQHLEALRLLGTARSRLGHHESARRALREGLRHDPLREDVWRALMRVEVAAGNIGRALACYQECREWLADELGADPSRPTQQLHAELLAVAPDVADQAAHRAAVARGVEPDVVPYVGLRAFGPEDADLYFGREAEVDALLTRLVSGGSVAVVGPSGCGKSSLVGAGLLPALARGAIPDSDTWACVTMVPGDDPFHALAAAVAAVDGAPDVDEVRSVLDMDGGLDLAAGRLAIGPASTARLLVVVDQLEELFTLGDVDRAARFVGTLLAGARRPGSRSLVVLVLRADFYAHAVDVPVLAELLSTRQYVLPPMDAERVEAAVQGPAARVGVTLEPGLLARIVADVVEAPGSLPMLQHLLAELWERRVDGVLTRGAYADLGGVTGALARRAESAYLGFAPAERTLARRVLLRGVRVGEDGLPARRPIAAAHLDELVGADRDEAIVRSVVDQLVAARLLVAMGGTGRVDGFELAHETLVEAWPRLGGWVDEARGWLLEHRRLADRAVDWERHDRHADFLLDGVPLDEARGLVAAVAGDEVEIRLSGPERELVAASVAARRAERAARRRRAKADDVRRLVALSAAAVANDPPLALLLAIEAADRSGRVEDTVVREVDGALHAAVFAQRLLHDHPDAGTFVALAPEGRTFLALAGDQAGVPVGTLFLREVRSGDVVRRFDGHGSGVVSAVFTPDGSRVVTAAHGDHLRVWDVDSGEEVARLHAPGRPTQLQVGDVDPAGRLVVAADLALPGEGGRTLVWDLASGRLVADVARLGYRGPMKSLGPAGAAFSPDGTLVAIVPWGSPAITQVLDVEHWEERYRIEGGDVHAAAAWSPDGRLLAVAGEDVIVSDAHTGRILRRWTAPVDAVGLRGLTWDDRSARLFLGARSIEVWDVAEGRRLETMRAGETWERLHAVALVSDGDMVVSGPPHDCRVRVWDVSRRAGTEVGAAPSGPGGIFALDPTGDRVVVPGAGLGGRGSSRTGVGGGGMSREGTGGPTGAVEVWDLAASACLGTGPVDVVDPHRLAWSPDGTRIAATSWSGLVVWNPRTNQRVFEVETAETERANADGAWMQVAFSPHGMFLAVSDLPDDRGREGYAVRVLDRDGEEVVRLVSDEDVSVEGLAWSTGGAWLAAVRFGGVGPMWLRDFGVDVWDVSTGEHVTTLSEEVVAVAAHPDRDLLVTGGRTGAIDVWHVPNRVRVARCAIVGRAGRGAVAVSPAGDRVAAGSEVGRLDVWDLTTGAHLVELPTGSASPVSDVAFSPDGRHVVAGQVGVGVRAWTLDHDELLEVARSRRSRDFTEAERAATCGTDERLPA